MIRDGFSERGRSARTCLSAELTLSAKTSMVAMASAKRKPNPTCALTTRRAGAHSVGSQCV
jgi:hypothetical protein